MLNVSWTIPFSDYNITSYNLKYRNLQGESIDQEIHITILNQSFHLISNLTPGHTYQAEMESVSLFGDAPSRESAVAKSNLQRTGILMIYRIGKLKNQ